MSTRLPAAASLLIMAPAALSPPPPMRPVTSFENSSQSSTASQLEPLQHSTSEISNSITAPIDPREITPPSSAASSNPNSRGDTPGSPTPRKHVIPSVNGAKQSPALSRSISPAGRPRGNSTAGSKRTASGQIKTTSQDDQGRTPRPQHIESSHTRASSTASIGSSSNVTEVSSGLHQKSASTNKLDQISQQLRTKLKYAMVKVQNGWQSRSLDEIESMASASPRSNVSGSAESPRRLIQPRAMRKWSESSSSDSGRSDTLHSIPSARLPSVPEFSGNAPRGLAPPADIVAGQRRRLALNTHGESISSKRSPRAARPSASQRTPSQNAAMEADAVETLLFMASPNNSGYHPHSQASHESSLRSTQHFSALTSPLRSQFSQTSMSSPKKVAFTDSYETHATSDRSILIDRMLDHSPAESEDDLSETLARVNDRATHVAA